MNSVEEVVAAMMDDARKTYLSDDFYVILDSVLSASKSSKLRKKLQGFSDRLRRPVELWWRERLVAVGCGLEEADAAVLIAHAMTRGVAVRKLLSDDPDKIEWTLKRGQAMVLSSLGRSIAAVGNSP